MGENGSSVLLVDDDKLIQTMVGKHLTQAGFKVTIAENGQEAIAKIRESIPSILLTDRNMPKMDGLELVRRLRAAHRTASMPIIIFSDLSKDDDAILGYSAGADEYMPKPFKVQLLEAKVRSLLGRTASRGAAGDGYRGKVVVFFHSKGGVGATTLAANTAAGLTLDTASTVALLDSCPEFGNAAMYLNVMLDATLADIDPGKLGELTDEDFGRYIGTDSHGVHVVAAADRPEQAELVSAGVLQMALDRLRRGHDYVIIDCPDSFSERTLLALDAADLICLVSEPTLPAMKAAKDCLQIFDRLHIPTAKVQVVFNQSRAKGAKEGEAAKFLGRPRFEFAIPYSEAFTEAANSGMPVVDGKGPAAESLRMLADRVRAGVKA